MLPDTPFDSQEFVQAFNESLAEIGRRRRAGRMQFLYMFDQSWKRYYSKVHAFIDSHVTRVLDETKQEASGNPEQGKERHFESEGRFQLLREMALSVRDPLSFVGRSSMSSWQSVIPPRFFLETHYSSWPETPVRGTTSARP